MYGSLRKARGTPMPRSEFERRLEQRSIGRDERRWN